VGDVIFGDEWMRGTIIWSNLVLNTSFWCAISVIGFGIILIVKRKILRSEGK